MKRWKGSLNHPRSVLRFAWVLSMFAVMFSACGANAGALLTLANDPFAHPSGIFEIAIPEGWVTEPGGGEEMVWLLPPSDADLNLSLVMIAEELPGADENAMLAAASARIEGYLQDLLPYEDYEIINQSEMRVARNPAILLDFARPLGESYHVGRMVLIYLPGHLVFVIGFGPRDEWDAFLPTFRKMVDGMTFSLEPFPLEGE